MNMLNNENFEEYNMFRKWIWLVNSRMCISCYTKIGNSAII